MLKRFAFGAVGGVLGYLVGLFGGMGLMTVLSSNHHDGSVEAAMTGAFVFGPLVALVGFVIAFAMARPKPATGSSDAGRTEPPPM